MTKTFKGYRCESLRLKGYDYSRPGTYFITMCVQNREHRFGKIEGGQMQLNEAGQMIQKWWLELGHKYSHIVLDEFVVMPNHIHGLLIIPWPSTESIPISQMLQWFKTMTTNEYICNIKQLGWPTFERRLWQRDYFEHIVRDEGSHRRIAQYIRENPLRWFIDRFRRL